MKWLFLSLFFLFSCTPAEENLGPESLDPIRRFEPIMATVEDAERIRIICESLTSKEDILSILVAEGNEFVFDFTQKNCVESEFPVPRKVITQIVENNSYYIFQAKNLELFGFSDVETTTKGALSKICQNTQVLMNPIQLSSTTALWFTTFTASEHCQSDADGLCIHLQKGGVIDGVNYRIHTNEWIKFRISQQKRGFFTERKFMTSLGCEGKQTQGKIAVLK